MVSRAQRKDAGSEGHPQGAESRARLAPALLLLLLPGAAQPGPQCPGRLRVALSPLLLQTPPPVKRAHPTPPGEAPDCDCRGSVPGARVSRIARRGKPVEIRVPEGNPDGDRGSGRVPRSSQGTQDRAVPAPPDAAPVLPCLSLLAVPRLAQSCALGVPLSPGGFHPSASLPHPHLLRRSLSSPLVPRPHYSTCRR